MNFIQTHNIYKCLFSDFRNFLATATHLDRFLFSNILHIWVFARTDNFYVSNITHWCVAVLLLCGESWMGVRVTAIWSVCGTYEYSPHRNGPKHQQRRAPHTYFDIKYIRKTPDQLVSDEKSHPIWPIEMHCKFKRAPVRPGRYEWDLYKFVFTTIHQKNWFPRQKASELADICWKICLKKMMCVGNFSSLGYGELE